MFAPSESKRFSKMIPGTGKVRVYIHIRKQRLEDKCGLANSFTISIWTDRIYVLQRLI